MNKDKKTMARNYCSTTSISEGLNDAISVEQLFELERLEESAYLAGFDAGQAQSTKLLVKALTEIRNLDWGTDYCDAKNMIADKALRRLEVEE